MKWFSLSHPCNKLTLCFRTNYAKAEPLEGGTASLFQLCVASVSLSVPVCEIWLLQLLFIKKLNVLPFLWDRLIKKKKRSLFPRSCYTQCPCGLFLFVCFPFFLLLKNQFFPRVTCSDSCWNALYTCVSIPVFLSRALSRQPFIKTASHICR